MKKWVSYKKALAYSGLRKAVFDRKLLWVGDHIRIQDDGKLLFSKRFLDFPNGHTVFSGFPGRSQCFIRDHNLEP